MISSQWPRFVLPIIRKEWEQKKDAVKSPVMDLFSVETSTDSQEYSQGIGAMGEIPEYNADTAEGAPAAIAHSSFSPLYEATFTHKEYADSIYIERKLMDDNKTGIIKRRAQTLGHAFGTTRSIHAASVFNNAFDTVEGPDGVYLCSASHPTNKKDSTAINNLGSTALSYAAIVATITAGMQMKDDKGAPMPSVYDTLVVPSALWETAARQILSLNMPGTADNDKNVLTGLRWIVDPYLSDANNWFMVDSAQSKMHLLWFDRVKPEIALHANSDFNLVAGYRGYMRHSFGWDDFRWIYGHAVS
jgi:hypothetical protein